MGKILSVGLDTSLLFTREMVLRQTGAEVWSAKFEPAITLMQCQFFDVVLLCHTLPDEDVRQILKLLELFWPVSRVLLVGERPNMHGCGSEIASQSGPITLVEQAARLLGHTFARPGPATLVPFSSGMRLSPANLARKS